MATTKDFIRIDLHSGLESQDSRIFIDPGKFTMVDLSDVRLLRCGVDTVRQLYRGNLRPGVLGLFEKPGTLVDFAGERWHAGRVGRDSGYQYKLQNADLGYILLIKNFNTKTETFGPHLKIEVSPHAIDQQSPEQLQEQLDYFASEVLTHIEVNQCAVHLALDLQGWTPPKDLVARMHVAPACNGTSAAFKRCIGRASHPPMGAVKPACLAQPAAYSCASTTKPNKPAPSINWTTGKASGVAVTVSTTKTPPTMTPSKPCGVWSCVITTRSSSNLPAARSMWRPAL